MVNTSIMAEMSSKLQNKGVCQQGKCGRIYNRYIDNGFVILSLVTSIGNKFLIQKLYDCKAISSKVRDEIKNHRCYF